MANDRQAAAAAAANRKLAATGSLLAWCLPFEANLAKQQGKTSSYTSLIIWPLVLISLIQVTSNLISNPQRDPTTSDLSSPPPHYLTCQDYPKTLPNHRHHHHNYHVNRMKAQVNEESGGISFRSSIEEECASTKLEDYETTMLPRQEGATRTCSSSAGRQTPQSPASSSSHESLLTAPQEAPLTYLKLFYNAIKRLAANTLLALQQRPKFIITAQAAIGSYELIEDNDIIVLNATNFNSELIQYEHPFPHIKLLEYHVPFCKMCVKFKHTFLQLSKVIYSWRNVIRLSAVDLSTSINSPIAGSWSIEIVPLMKVHPPPNTSIATNLNKHLTAWSTKLSSSVELQRIMFREYNASSLMVKTLSIIPYTIDSKRNNVTERVQLLKQDLLHYIEDYVRLHPDDLPETWPNLRPVSERTLVDLRQRHPRPELFLIFEGGNNTETPSEPSLGLRIMMDLSSTTAWKAVRYVHVNENRELLEDVIAQKRKEAGEHRMTPASGDGQQQQAGQSVNSINHQNSAASEQVELLENFLANSSSQVRDVLLVHIDDSHSPYGHDSESPKTKFPYLTVISGSDLVVAGAINSEESTNPTTTTTAVSRSRRNTLDPYVDAQNQMNSERKVKLVAHYINQTYIETKEDKEFLEALLSYDHHPTLHNLKREAVDRYRATRLENQNTLSKNLEIQRQQDEERQNKNSSSSFKQMFNWIHPSSMSNSSVKSAAIRSDHASRQDDYDDKLKAIRYIFFQEVPRKTLADKSVPEKLENLDTLISLASVIKAYFPLPDLASLQFIDAIHGYLAKQRIALLASLNSNNQDQAMTATANNFELRSLKQVIKSIEAEGKRLPEVRNWKHCKHSGYPCALWRLFHTLTAFEYKKLNQINQLSTLQQQQQQQQQQLSTGSSSQQQNQAVGASNASQQPLSPDAQPVAASQQAQAQALGATPTPVSPAVAEQLQPSNVPQSPVERLVSPPSSSASLSLTIATPTSSSSQGQQQHQQHAGINQNIMKTQESEIAELPQPVLLVMRDYVTQFFSCEECAKNFRQEAAELSFERIRQQEPAEFSILWLWETHNRVSKRLSINPDTNPPEHPKLWFPTYEQCSKCYRKPPSYLKDTTVELAAIFHESIEWNRDEILNFLQKEFTRQPMDMGTNLFGYSVPYGFNYIIVIGLSSLLLIVLLRCASCYIERQRRHKASLLNGNGAHYSVELQRC